MGDAIEFEAVVRFGLSPDSYVLPGDRFDPREDLLVFGDLVTRAIGDALTVVDSRERRRWENHRQASREMVGYGERVLPKLLRAQAGIDDAVREFAELAGSDAAAAPVPDDLDADRLVEHLRAQVGETLAAAIPGTDHLEDELESGFRPPSSFDLDPGESAAATVWADVLETQRHYGIWFVAAGYEELFRAEQFAATEAASPEPVPDAALEAIAARVRQFDAEIADQFRQLYGALVAPDWDRLEARARRALSYPFEVREDLRRFGTTLHGARLERERSDEWHADNRVMAIGRTQAELHEVVWKLTMLLAASYRYLFVARQRPGHPEAVEEVEVARETAFDSLVDEGEPVDLDDLLDEPGAYDGTLVQTGGFVRNLRYDGDAPGSKFDLVDVWNDRRVRVFLPYRNLGYWSVRDGAYVRPNGTFAASSEHVDGDPEIELDVVSVADNAERSWLDHVAHSLAADGVFDRYPSRVNAYWSLEPPEDTGRTMTATGSSSDGGSGDGGSGDGGSTESPRQCPQPPIERLEEYLTPPDGPGFVEEEIREIARNVLDEAPLVDSDVVDKFETEDGQLRVEVDRNWGLYATGSGLTDPTVRGGITFKYYYP